METPELSDETIGHFAHEIERVSAALWPTLRAHLAGKGDAVQGGVVADIVARYLVGYPSAHREEALLRIMSTARALIPANDTRQYGGLGHPQDRH